MPLPKDPIKAEATRKKMSEAAKKRMDDPEIRNKIREANIGKKQSPETIAKRVVKLKGKKHPPRSEEWRRKHSELGKKRWEDPEYRNKMTEEAIGKKQSQETIAKRISKIKDKPRAPRTIKNCAFCGKELVLVEWEKNRKFCSAVCKGKWQSENAIGEKGAHWKGGGVTKKCEECGKEFTFEKHRKEIARFCSHSCKGIWMSKNLIGENNPSYGKSYPPHTDEWKRAMSIRNSGNGNPNWTGGPKDYCEKWSLEFRRRIRAFFDHNCAECGTSQNEKLLHCHHVYYDKKACCSVNENGKYFSNLGIKEHPYNFEIVGDPNKFVALCDNCHKRTSGKKKREYWARHFEEIINNYYLGRSYFTKEEYEKIG
jgi:endogenous inhibitor of DNA gyrase (YacG/DUF329 family)